MYEPVPGCWEDGTDKFTELIDKLPSDAITTQQSIDEDIYSSAAL